MIYKTSNLLVQIILWVPMISGIHIEILSIFSNQRGVHGVKKINFRCPKNTERKYR